MAKVERYGKIAVIISTGYGGGWSTWNKQHPQCLFDPNLVEMIENKNFYQINRYCKSTYGLNFRTDSVEDLEVVWVPKNTKFRVCEYDGIESIQYAKDIKWFTA